ncbi:EPHX4 hydrolase, partial [Atractosteus spatula]|nr:EPHX4 hydrolase [Atractosteus spatula]
MARLLHNLLLLAARLTLKIRVIGYWSLIYSYCAVCASVALLKLLWTILQKPSKTFQWGVREAPPACLNDTSLGTHCYVRIKESGLRFHYVAAGERGKPLMLFLHGFPEFCSTPVHTHTVAGRHRRHTLSHLTQQSPGVEAELVRQAPQPTVQLAKRSVLTACVCRQQFSWRHQLREFKSEFRVVAVDMRGYGESDVPVGAENYRLDHLITDVRDIVECLGTSGYGEWNRPRVEQAVASQASLQALPVPGHLGKGRLEQRNQFPFSWLLNSLELELIPSRQVGEKRYPPGNGSQVRGGIRVGEGGSTDQPCSGRTAAPPPQQEFIKGMGTLHMPICSTAPSCKRAPAPTNELAVRRVTMSCWSSPLGSRSWSCYNRCYLVGHDWGGMVAWLFAIHYPEMVTKLIVLNCPHPSVFADHALRRPLQLAKCSCIFLFQLPRLPELMLSVDDFKALKGFFPSRSAGVRWKSSSLRSEDTEAYLYVFSQPGALTGPLNYYRNIFSSLPLTQQEVRSSVLLLWGERDALLEQEMAEASRLYVRNHLRLNIISGAGHWLQQEQPDIVNTLMWTFLKEGEGWKCCRS